MTSGGWNWQGCEKSWWKQIQHSPWGREKTNRKHGILAQLGEHLPYKQGVTGSSPVGPTCTIKQYNAGVAELADAQDLKSCCGNTVPVRFRSPALSKHLRRKMSQGDAYVRVAQLDRASGYGPEGRGFESCHAHLPLINIRGYFFINNIKLILAIRSYFLLKIRFNF